MHPVTFSNPFDRASQPLHTVAVIPARYDSTRLPGKALADIAGRPMIEHVYRRAALAEGVDAVVVATDDDRIAAAVRRFGGVARQTDAGHLTGTDRVAEVARELQCEIVVNVQGDEPLIDPRMITQAVEVLDVDGSLSMATLARVITNPDDYASPNVVKVVMNRQGDAMYFSRSPVPAYAGVQPAPLAYQHVGLYAYRRSFLLELAALPRTPLERAEALEQLRVLEHGFSIRVGLTAFESVGVDTAEDLERVRAHVRTTEPGRQARDSVASVTSMELNRP